MKYQTPLRSLAVLLVCTLTPGATVEAEPDRDTTGLDEILGSVGDWKITPATYELGIVQGKKTLQSPTGLFLESSVKKSPPLECLVSYRLKPAKGGSTSVTFQLNIAEPPGKALSSLAFSVSATSGQTVLSCNASVQGGKSPQFLAGMLHFEAVSDRSLAWSEEVRRSIEAQIANAPRIEESLLSFRCTIERGRFRT